MHTCYALCCKQLSPTEYTITVWNGHTRLHRDGGILKS
uniref:Uncharacterized protein n=1 Tax=Arundo donax TaxID=35708 RepID=A0A0A9E2U3_ARUDO